MQWPYNWASLPEYQPYRIEEDALALWHAVVHIIPLSTICPVLQQSHRPPGYDEEDASDDEWKLYGLALSRVRRVCVQDRTTPRKNYDTDDGEENGTWTDTRTDSSIGRYGLIE